jgi:hypothetical protein
MARLKSQRQKGLRALKGALRSEKGRGTSFREIREAVSRSVNARGLRSGSSKNSR